MKKKRLGILTGGGDCPGLNAAIKWVVYGAICHSARDRQRNPIEVIAIKEGWEGLLMLDPKKGIKDDRYVQVLTPPVVRKIDRDGGTAIGTSRTNPFSVKDEMGNKQDKSAAIVRNIEVLGLDAIIVAGGEDALGVANRLYQRYGIPVVGIPKTIDLDLPGTDYSLGFDSAVNNIKMGFYFGTTAVSLAVRKEYGKMVAVQGGAITSAPLSVLNNPPRVVDVDLMYDKNLLNARRDTAMNWLMH
jgi:6-phosphofructokinase 1